MNKVHIKMILRKIHAISIGIFFILSVLSATALPASADTNYDLNKDGYPDIVFSNQSNGSSYELNSYVYWGDTDSPYTTKTLLATQGATGNSIADLNNDGYPDIIFSNWASNSSSNINSYVYWGAESSPYTTKTELATHGATANSVADLNSDGYLDIVFSNLRNGTTYNINSYVYWGAAGSPYTSKTEIPTVGAQANSVADLNNDGYLDIVFSNRNNSSNSYNINSYVYWGAASSPYTTKTELATQGALGNAVADLNGDGYQDIVFSNYYNGSTGNINSYIYWGAENSPYTTKTELATHSARDVSIADLNGDGYLDIVFSNNNNGSTSSITSYIYWGAESSPYTTKTELATYAATGNCVADINGDGYLDIIFSNQSTSIKSYVYWGAATSPYTTKSELSTIGGQGVSVAGSNIFGSDSAYGTVIPLWVTEGDYDLSLLTSPVYQAIATKYPLLNDHALTLSDEEIAMLTQLYFDGKNGLDPEPITISNVKWEYFGETIEGKNFGDYWYDQGNYYFYLGSGLEGTSIPEPGCAFGLLAGFFVPGFRRLLKRRVRG